MPFDLPLNKGYEIEGSWTGPAWDTGHQAFARSGSFTVRKSDADIDPKEFESILRTWVSSSGVQSTQSDRVGVYGEEIRYGTPKTVGTLQYRILSESPTRSLAFTIEVYEKPRPQR